MHLRIQMTRDPNSAAVKISNRVGEGENQKFFGFRKKRGVFYTGYFKIIVPGAPGWHSG